MKMSDVFELPLNCGLVDNVDVGYAIELEPEKSVTDEQACAVDYAINNHDRLTEENAKLREVLKRSLDVVSFLNVGYNQDINADRYMESARKLLSQLKDQNNDK